MEFIEAISLLNIRVQKMNKNAVFYINSKVNQSIFATWKRTETNSKLKDKRTDMHEKILIQPVEAHLPSSHYSKLHSYFIFELSTTES